MPNPVRYRGLKRRTLMFVKTKCIQKQISPDINCRVSSRIAHLQSSDIYAEKLPKQRKKL